MFAVACLIWPLAFISNLFSIALLQLTLDFLPFSQHAKSIPISEPLAFAQAGMLFPSPLCCSRFRWHLLSQAFPDYLSKVAFLLLTLLPPSKRFSNT